MKLRLGLCLKYEIALSCIILQQKNSNQTLIESGLWLFLCSLSAECLFRFSLTTFPPPSVSLPILSSLTHFLRTAFLHLPSCGGEAPPTPSFVVNRCHDVLRDPISASVTILCHHQMSPSYPPLNMGHCLLNAEKATCVCAGVSPCPSAHTVFYIS